MRPKTKKIKVIVISIVLLLYHIHKNKKPPRAEARGGFCNLFLKFYVVGHTVPLAGKGVTLFADTPVLSTHQYPALFKGDSIA